MPRSRTRRVRDLHRGVVVVALLDDLGPESPHGSFFSGLFPRGTQMATGTPSIWPAQASPWP